MNSIVCSDLDEKEFCVRGHASQVTSTEHEIMFMCLTCFLKNQFFLGHLEHTVNNTLMQLLWEQRTIKLPEIISHV